MYTYDWAHSVVTRFYEYGMRANSIERCIIARQMAMGIRVLTTGQIRYILTKELQTKDRHRIWYRFKRLCKLSPYRADLGDELAVNLAVRYYEIHDEERQLTLEFT